MSTPITGYGKATELLYRWLRRDAGQRDVDDATLDDETNDYLQAYTLPRVERDQAVLQACAELVIHEHGHDYEPPSLVCGAGQVNVTAAEWERRQFAAKVADFKRTLGGPNHEGQRLILEGWRRLESLR